MKTYKFNPIILIILVASYIYITCWSISQVFHGLKIAGNFNQYDDWQIVGFATIIQIGVSSIMFYGADLAFSKKPRYVLGFLLGIVLGVICLNVEVFHSVLTQIEASQGEGLVVYERSNLDSINNQIKSLDTTISYFYKVQKENFLNGATNAENGIDETGIAMKGRIYRARMSNFDMSGQFSDLGVQAVGNEGLPNDLTIAFSKLASANDQLKSKYLRLLDYVASTGIKRPTNIDDQMGQINEKIQNARPMYSGLKKVDESSLSMMTAFSLPQELWLHGLSVLHPKTALALVYACVPFMLQIVLMIVIMFVASNMSKARDIDISSLRQEVHEEKDRYHLMEELKSLKIKQTISKAIKDGHDFIFKKKVGNNDHDE